MIRYASFGALLGLLIAPLALSQQQQQAVETAANRVELGRLANGAAVAFVRAGSGDWGIEISGGTAPQMLQSKPAQIEVIRGDENVSDLTAGYQSVQKEADAVVAKATLSGGGEAAFAVEDCWRISGSVLSLNRNVKVTGSETNAGFYSAILYYVNTRMALTCWGLSVSRPKETLGLVSSIE